MYDIFSNYSSALLGGAIIGLSACLMMLFYGRITGISGLIWNTVQNRRSSLSSSGIFLGGMIIGALCVAYATDIETPPIHSNVFIIILSGLLVGYGTKLGSGCTSGHGICGISRLSIRSLAATGTFMTSGIATVFFMRHLI